MTANPTTPRSAGANPTPSMIEAGLLVFCEYEPGDGTTGSELVSGIWAAMQSASLTEWDQRLARFQALFLLFEADDQWGPLYVANAASGAELWLWRTAKPEDRDRRESFVGEANRQATKELTRHMAAIYDPLVEAGLALVRTPAPDLAAVRVKHDACNAEGFRLVDYEDEEGELFDIIAADVKRLVPTL